MLGVRTGVGETLAALLALKRFFTRVQTAVLGQVVLVFEGFGAHLAGEGTSTCTQKSSLYIWNFDTHNLDP